ncbi:MAG TPA: hypothetical protein VME20_05725 [Acidimicrobiales bacterium]|nr:hypothetical protein [Acidimicrobiales bacterium]
MHPAHLIPLGRLRQSHVTGAGRKALVARSERSAQSARSPLGTASAVALAALSVLFIPGQTALAADAPAAATAGGAEISCSNTDSILGPLHSAVTLAAGTTGSVLLGGLNGGKGSYIGNCTLNGTIPAGWTVTEASWISMSATTGSGNAGRFVLETPNSTFTDSGTFINSGTFEDSSQGLLQMIDVTEFINTGTVLAAGGGFGTAGQAFNPPCPKCTFVDKGTLVVNPKQGFSSGSTFVLALGGTIVNHGTFGLANESAFDVEGGSVTKGELVSTQYLGLSPPTVEFAPNLPPASHGTIEITNSAFLDGVIAKHWELDVTGGSIAAANQAGNAGTFFWDHDNNATFTDATTFTNSGTFTDTTTGWLQQIEVSRFVNTGTVTSDAPGFGMSTASGISGPVFVNEGDLLIEPKASFGVAGTFELAGGTVINHGGFGIDKSILEVTAGSLRGNPASVNYYLGAGPATVTFGPSVQASSTGTVDFGIGLTINGVIPKGWVIDNIGGIGPALTVSHSGNDGTIIWGARAQVTATGTFTNAGTIDATGGPVDLAGANFVNAASGKVALTDDGAFSSSGSFRNEGSLTLGPGNGISVGGNFSQVVGASLVVGAGGNFSLGGISVTGTAYLGGALTIAKMAGLKVASGDTANIVSAHTISGRFRPVVGLGRPGPALVLTYNPTAATVAPPAAH